MRDKYQSTRSIIAHITLQPYENDARVLRSIHALEAAGFTCPVIAPEHGFNLPDPSLFHKAHTATTFGGAALLGKTIAERAFFSLLHHQEAVAKIVALKPAAIHAHDWDGLLIGRRAAQLLQIPFVYDSHELAGHMHGDRMIWSSTVRPLIRSLEGQAARDAAFVIAVGRHHATALQTNLALKAPCVVVRNISQTPALQSLPERPKNAPILLHYHGALAHGRGLETAIEALALLPPNFSLRLTGPWLQSGMETNICSRIKRLGLQNRVILNAALPHEQLVSHASEADIGLCMLPKGSRHNEIALPNKFFDYLKAGIAIVSSGMKDVGFVQEADAGIHLADNRPETLTGAITSLNRIEIDVMRSAALALAKHHDWPTEAQVLVEAWKDVGVFS